MKINWKTRLKNPYFWIAIAGVILSASGIAPETLTSWAAVGQAFLGIVSNPVCLVSVIVAVLGVILDPTTAGLGDSKRALTYTKPNKDAAEKEKKEGV